ncbi:hypothetical protein PFLG_00692 [Plasmodium falciparum RAJ116]|uniref:Uncharacterized protein n=1 Tax=Plasmodium falciparum RAJ116 TaxID=580058 RepID=A0A0L0CWF8_PLAFA|nr:hypothetical protein PFLG_00692 [Plasmodium falciparum RAJ116]
MALLNDNGPFNDNAHFNNKGPINDNEKEMFSSGSSRTSYSNKKKGFKYKNNYKKKKKKHEKNIYDNKKAKKKKKEKVEKKKKNLFVNNEFLICNFQYVRKCETLFFKYFLLSLKPIVINADINSITILFYFYKTFYNFHTKKNEQGQGVQNGFNTDNYEKVHMREINMREINMMKEKKKKKKEEKKKEEEEEEEEEKKKKNKENVLQKKKTKQEMERPLKDYYYYYYSSMNILNDPDNNKRCDIQKNRMIEKNDSFFINVDENRKQKIQDITGDHIIDNNILSRMKNMESFIIHEEQQKNDLTLTLHNNIYNVEGEYYNIKKSNMNYYNNIINNKKSSVQIKKKTTLIEKNDINNKYVYLQYISIDKINILLNFQSEYKKELTNHVNDLFYKEHISAYNKLGDISNCNIYLKSLSNIHIFTNYNLLINFLQNFYYNQTIPYIFNSAC